MSIIFKKLHYFFVSTEWRISELLWLLLCCCYFDICTNHIFMSFSKYIEDYCCSPHPPSCSCYLIFSSSNSYCCAYIWLHDSDLWLCCLCSLNWQHQLCKNPRPNPDIKTLFTDHTCSPPNGPLAPTPVNLPVAAVAKPAAYTPLGAHGVWYYAFEKILCVFPLL